MKINASIDKLLTLWNIFFFAIMLMFVTNLTLRGREKYELKKKIITTHFVGI